MAGRTSQNHPFLACRGLRGLRGLARCFRNAGPAGGRGGRGGRGGGAQSNGFEFTWELSMGDLQNPKMALNFQPGNLNWELAMALNFQDPTDGGTLVPYFWPYFLGRFPEI